MILVEFKGDPNLDCVAYPDRIGLMAWYTALRQKLLAIHDGVIPIENGYRFLFSAQEEIRALSDQDSEDKLGEDLKAYANLEADRCPFLTIRVEFWGGGYALILEGSPAAQAWLNDDYQLAK